MGRARQPVKTRAYDASSRQARAAQQHAATLDAALSLFLDQGYARTTVEAIAGAAAVSAATIYKSYGGKAGLVRDLCQRALAGEGPVPAETRSDALRSSGDARQVIEGWGQLAAEVSPRISPLMLLLRTAAESDAEAAALYEELDRARLARMTDNGRFLAGTGQLRDGLTAADARDVLWLYTAPELFDLLVNRRRWSRARFAGFLTDSLTRALL